ncbi:MAG: PH domain-containing protein [Acidobacteriota bacterium]|nr:PH domain-containing protein [Acidobacteriota bacterium]
MGLLSGLLGNASEIDASKIEKQFELVLVQGERVEKAYKLIRDLLVFTNKRLVLVDKQGLTGKKQQFTSIPYKSIVRFSKETSGHFDLDAEIKIWLSSTDEPISLEFKKNKNVHEIYLVLSGYVLN